MRAVRFSFEGSPTFDGFTDGTTWNGWPNVWVTPRTRGALVRYFRREGDDQSATELAAAPVTGSPGVVSLANGYTPTLEPEGGQDPAPDSPELGEISPRWKLAPAPFGAWSLIDTASRYPLRLRMVPSSFTMRADFTDLARAIVAALNSNDRSA